MKKTTSKNQDYEKLGKMLVEFHDLGFASKKSMYKMTFVKGILQGFGGVIGATLMVTLFLWILSLFGSVPIVGNLVETIRNSLNTN